jgi:hypothetical protein
MSSPPTRFIHVQFLGPRLIQGTFERRIEAAMRNLGATIVRRSPRWLEVDEAQYDHDLYRWVEITHGLEIADDEDLLGELYGEFEGPDCSTIHVEVADSADHQLSVDAEGDDDTP